VVNFSEQELFAALASGNITAFEMYFKSYYQPLCNYAFTFLRDKEEAEEIVQTAFVSVWEKRTSLNIHSSSKSYMYAMVRNACLNILKHEKIKQKYAGEELALSKPGYEAVNDTIDSAELESRILLAIEKLPEQCRLVFKLSRFEELKYSEIAEQLHLSVKTVENHMGKALRIMREQLKDYLPLLLTVVSAGLTIFREILN
jgi:RNA polymerase sigma-70 factor, ECF subfamily